MHKRLRIGLLLSWVALQATAQTPFTASWDFENNAGGSVNSPNVSISSANLSNVNDAGYPAGATGDAISIRLWPTTGWDGSKYVEVSLTPQNYRMSVSSISFDCNRSAQGPTQLSVRTNQDNFGSDIGSTSVGTGFSNQNYSVSFNNLENTVSFRIYAHTAVDNLGTLRLDNLRINGTVAVIPLPVELTYFRGQVFNNQVQLSWETTWERNAARFEVQRSSDLKEFITLNTLAAAGNSHDRTRYTFTDASPMPGVNYYRLRQTDHDGKFEFLKIISVNLDTNAPQIWVYGNPTSARQTQVRLQKLTPADLQLYSLNGQLIPFNWQAISTNDYILQINAPAGWYWLIGQHQAQKISRKVLLIEP